MGNAWRAPLINDVSTDLEDPPTLIASSRPPTISDHVKAACRRAYPDLQPLMVPGAEPAAVLAAARRAAAAALPRARIVREEAAAGRLELLDVTRLLRFKDDVAIRVRPAAGGGSAVVDVRSASRLGKGDLGTNAARICTLLEALKKELGLEAS